MKKSFKRNGVLLSILSTCLFQIYSCSSENLQYGYLSASVKFPERSGFSLKFINENTQIILVQIKGRGLNTPLTFELSRDFTTRIIDTVPVGEKNISARALDINGNVLSSGGNIVNVIANKLNKVELELKENSDLKIKDPCIVFIDPKDLPLSALKEKIIKNAGCQIVKPSISPVGVSENNSGITTAIPSFTFPSSIRTNKKCTVFLNSKDVPLSPVKEKAIKDAGCEIVLPNSAPVFVDPNNATNVTTLPPFPEPPTIINKKPCTVFLNPKDVPLSPVKEKAIKDAGCEIVISNTNPVVVNTPVPTPIITPTSIPTTISTPIPTSVPISGGGGGSSIGADPTPTPIPTSSVKVNIDVIDGDPLPTDITITGG